MANPRWRAELFQVGCVKDGMGEGGIMIIEDRTQLPAGSTARGIVHKAIMIDAGWNCHSSSNMRQTMADIKELYKVQTDCLQFDAVVISHWDQDHWFAFARQKDCILNDSVVGYDSATGLVRCFKYNTVNGVSTPVTRLYCPYWGWKAAKAAAKKGFIKATGQSNLVDANGASFPVLWAKGNTSTQVAECWADPALILGANLVTGTLLGTTTTPSAMTDLDTLIANNDPWSGGLTGCPGLYVVGARGQVLGSSQSILPLPGQQMDDQNELGDRDAVNEPLPATSSDTYPWANLASVMLLLVWKADGANPTRASLYTGGDAEWENEKMLTSWLQASSQTVDVLKLGHHGSLRGVYPGLLDAAKPQSFLISAGIMHCHPRPENIWLIDAYLRSQLSAGDPMSDRIWPTCFPYWLGKTLHDDGVAPTVYAMSQSLDTDYLSKDYVKPNDAAALEFVNKLGTYYTAAGYSTAQPSPQTKLDAALAETVNLVASNQATIDNLEKQLEQAQEDEDSDEEEKLAEALDDARAEKRRLTLYDAPRQMRFARAGAITEEMMRQWSRIHAGFYPYEPVAADKPIGVNKRPAAEMLVGRAIKFIRYISVLFVHDQAARPQFNLKLESGSVVAPALTKKNLTAKRRATLSLLNQTADIVSISSPSPTLTQTAAQLRRACYLTPTWNAQLSGASERVVQAQQQNLLADGELGSVLPGAIHMGTVVSPPSSPTLAPVYDGALPVVSGAFDVIITSDSAPIPSSVAVPGTYVALDDLVASLDSQTIPLQGQSIGIDFSKTWTLEVSSDCDLVQWVVDSFGTDPTTEGSDLIAATLSMSGPASLAGVQSFLDGFELSLTFQDGPSVAMVFNSRVDNIAAAAADITLASVEAFVGPEGLLKSSPGLVYGLTSTEALNDSVWTLDNLFSFIMGPTASGKSALSATPSYINGKTTVQIDLKQVNYYTLTLRLGATTPRLTPGSTLSLFSTSAQIPNTSISSVTFLGRRHTTRGSLKPVSTDQLYVVHMSSEVVLEAQINLFDKGGSQLPTTFQAFIDLNDSGVSLRLRPLSDLSQNQTALSDIQTWIEGVVGIGTFYNGSWLNTLTTDNTIYVREVAVDFALDADNAWTFLRAVLTFEVDLDRGIDPDGPSQQSRIPLSMVFRYESGSSGANFTFHGCLWPCLTPGLVWSTFIQEQGMKPEASLVPELAPLLDPTLIQYYISLAGLLQSGSPQHTSLPNFIPDKITTLSLTLSESELTFLGRIEPSGTTTLAKVPPVSSSSIDISYDMTQSQASFSVTIALTDRFQQRTGQLLGSIEFATPLWTLQASAPELQVSNLYTLFSTTSSTATDGDAVMNALDSISILDFNLQYSFDGSGAGSSFTSSASIQIHDFQLTLLFSYDVDWTFSASLDVESINAESEATVGDALRAISPSVADALPDFLDDFRLGIASGDTVSLDVYRCRGQSVSYITTIFVVKTQFIEFTYLQASPNSGSTSDTMGFATKRVLRVIVDDLDRLPTPPDVPFLQGIGSPFSRVELLWTNQGLTRQDIDIGLNPVYTNPQVNVEAIQYKNSSSPSNGSSTATTDQVVAQGTHIIVVAEIDRTPTVVLDYCFTPSASAQPASNPASNAVDGDDADSNDGASSTGTGFGGDDPTPAQPVKANPSSGTMTKQQKTLVISGLTMSYDNASQQVSIHFNALISLGPVEVDLQGFGMVFPISIFQNAAVTINPTIAGLALNVNKPPVTVTGELAILPTSPTTTEYIGGLAANVDPYSFMAAGYYGELSNYRSMLVFVQLQGPFIELEFGKLSDLTAGFGYHSNMTIPSVDAVTSFPFLQTVQGSDALQVLTSLTSASSSGPAWFTPFNGPMWFAAGLTAKLFQALSVDAVVAVDIQSDDTILGVFADCQATIPAGSAAADSFVFIDIGILATVDFGKGTFQVEGQLTPKSFILNPSCKLSGGFALCYWFNGSGHDGDWVFTVGGYHPAFQVPAWYPTPKRLQVQWVYDDNITIQGDAYFAITPKVCMGGGSLALMYNSGRLHASLLTYADFLMDFKPFSYMIDAGVEVRASYTIGWGCLSHTFHLDMGASINMTGPPLAGVAHVDWCIFAFDVHFGASPQPAPALGWNDFRSFLLQDAVPTVTATTGSEIGAIVALHPTAGYLGISKDASPALVPDWLVDGTTFTFRMSSLIPTQRAMVNAQTLQVANVDQAYFRPMHLTTQPTLYTIIGILRDNVDDETVMKFSGAACTKNAPKGVWGQYNPAEDPGQGVQSANLFRSDDATLNLCFGFDISNPTPTDSGALYTVTGSELYVDAQVSPAMSEKSPSTLLDLDIGSYLHTTPATQPDLVSGLGSDKKDGKTGIDAIVAEWIQIASPASPQGTYAARLYGMAAGRTQNPTLFTQQCTNNVCAIPQFLPTRTYNSQQAEVSA